MEKKEVMVEGKLVSYFIGQASIDFSKYTNINLPEISERLWPNEDPCDRFTINTQYKEHQIELELRTINNHTLTQRHQSTIFEKQSKDWIMP